MEGVADLAGVTKVKVPEVGWRGQFGEGEAGLSENLVISS